MNEQQYRTTQQRIEGLEKGLAALETSSARLDPLEHECQQSAHHRLIGDLQNQIKQYEELSSGAGTRTIKCEMLDELPKGLIKARIVKGLSVDELAQRLGWESALLDEYEETEYEQANWAKMIEVADALKVQVESIIQLDKA